MQNVMSKKRKKDLVAYHLYLVICPWIELIALLGDKVEI